MRIYKSLKSIWKKLGVNGQVKNFSTVELWVIETDSSIPTARKLKAGFKTPIQVDVDAFKRIDGLAIDKHKNWWKFYDVSTAEIHGDSKKLTVSIISKTAVGEYHFNKFIYLDEYWGSPIQLVTNVRRDKNKKITHYFVKGIGWISSDKALKMTCHHEIDNARPVFPKSGTPFIRTRRDSKWLNNLSVKGLA